MHEREHADGLGRRRVLQGAGLAGAAAAVAAVGVATPASADDGSSGLLTGSWLVIRQDAGDPTKVQGVVSFAAGGVFITHDIAPAGPPFTGTWASRGRQFRATMYSGFSGGPDSGSGGGGGGSGTGGPAPMPVAQVRLTGTLQRGTISGTYTVTVTDATTGAVVESNTGSFSGTRIEA